MTAWKDKKVTIYSIRRPVYGPVCGTDKFVHADYRPSSGKPTTVAVKVDARRDDCQRRLF